MDRQMKHTEDIRLAVERIRRMEIMYNLLLDAVRKDPERIDTENEWKHAVDELTEYLAGGKWMHDYELDEAGMLPADLKRGVLSQDGLYNLLSELGV